MAVNLTDLSLPQLEGLKTQLDQVILKRLVFFNFDCVLRCRLYEGDNLKENGRVGVAELAHLKLTVIKYPVTQCAS